MARPFCICRWQPDLPEIECLRLKEAGIEQIETGFDWLRDLDRNGVEKTTAAYHDAGVRIRSIHAPFGEEDDLTHLNRNKRDEAGKRLIAFMEKVAWCGAEVVVVHPGHACEEKEVEIKESLLPKLLPPLLQKAEEWGLAMALENLLPRHPFFDCSRLLSVVQESCWDGLGICFDSGHAHVAGDVLSLFHAAQDRIIALHLHDNDRTRDMHLQPGYGTLPWESLLEGIEHLDPSIPLTVEAAPWAAGSYGIMMRELDALQQGRHLHRLPGLLARGHLICSSCGRMVILEEGRCSCACS